MTKDEKMQQKMLEYVLSKREASWAQQFKFAVSLGPSIDEDNFIEDVRGFEAVFHFFAIGWNVLFAFIPPRRYCQGWLTFLFGLLTIGMCTAVVAEVANLLGCTVGLK